MTSLSQQSLSPGAGRELRLTARPASPFKALLAQALRARTIQPQQT